MTYSSSLAMSRQRFSGRNQNTISLHNAKPALGPVSSTVMLIILACMLGLLYLTQVTKTNAYGYQINALQTQQTALTQQHNDLEVASARLQALDRIKNSDVAKSLVSVAPSATVQN